MTNPVESIAKISKDRKKAPHGTFTEPIIAVVDTGIVSDHAILSPYRRGTYVAPTSIANNPDTHGCCVASRAVFGDLDYDDGPPSFAAPRSAWDSRTRLNR